MGNPASKEISSNQARNYSHTDLQPYGERNDRDTPKRKNDEVEAVPYTSYSIPKLLGHAITTRGDEDDEDTDTSLSSFGNFTMDKKKDSTLISPRNTNSKTESIFLPETIQDPDLIALHSLPVMNPLVQSSDRRPGRKLIYGETLDSKFHVLDAKGLLTICSKYKEVLEQTSSAAAKHQRAIPPKMKAVESMALDAFRSYSFHVQQVNGMTEYIRQISNISESLVLNNRLLNVVLRKIEELCDQLPEDLKMEDPIPVPLLTLNQSLNLARDKNMIFSAQKNSSFESWNSMAKNHWKSTRNYKGGL